MRIYQLLLILFGLATANVSAQHRFIENGGQWNDAVNYRADIPGGKVYFESDRFTFDLYDVETTDRVFAAHSGNPNPLPPPKKLNCHAYQMIFKGATGLPLGEKAFDTNYSFFIGKDSRKWAGDLKGYESIRYKEIYQGIDLKVYSNAVLKYDFILKPGASPNLIQVKYAGVNPKVNRDGQLEIRTSVGDVLESKPFAYQFINNEITKVECQYIITDNVLTFELGEYNDGLELIIDPELIFSTFSGSFANNFGYSATYDSDGHLYAGSSAFGTGYPVTIGAYQTFWAGGTGNGGTDIALTKFSVDGSSLIYSTYLGGANDDLPHSLIVNDNNELCIYGTTSSADFPTTANAFQTVFAGGTTFQQQTGIGVVYLAGSDITVSRLSSSGGELLASTFLGGEGNDGLNTSSSLRENYADEIRGEIEIDNSGNIIIGSCTYSNDFPVSASAFQTAKDADQEGVLIRLNPDLTEVLAATFFGGNGADAIYSIEVGADGKITVAGGTNSTNLPTTANAYQTTYGGGYADGYIAVFDENMESLDAMTFYGSTAYDQIYFVERDDLGNPHIFGQTRAAGTTFIDNADFSVPNSGMLLSSFSSNLESRIWSTVFGNGQNIPSISPTAFAVDICNRIYLSGWGGDANGFGGTLGLPITADAIQSTTDNSDFYFMVLEGDASTLTFATFYGGSQSAEHVDGGTSRFDKSGKIYQAACAGCHNNDDWPSFPDNAYSAFNNSNGCNLGVVKIDFDLPIIFANFEIEDFCLPDTLQLENTSSVYSGSNPVYQWIFPNNEVIFGENPNYSIDSPGTYEIKLILFEPNACNISDTITKTVQVFPELNIGLQDSLINCTSPDMTIEANTQGAAIFYQWASDTDFTSIISQGQTDSIVSFTPENAQYVYLNTSNGLCEKMDSIFVVPKPAFDLSIGDTLLCSVQEIPVSISLSGNLTASDVNWLPQDKIISGLGTQNLVFDASETLSISANATSQYGCELNQSIEITVNPIFLQADDDTLACMGDPIPLSAESIGLAQTFLWSNEANFATILNPSGDSTITVIPTSITYYYVQAINGGCSLIDSVAVSLLSAGTSITANKYICAGDTTRIFVTNDFPGSQLSHVWQPEEFILSGQATNSIRVSPSEPITYTVLSTTTDGCEVENAMTVYISNLGNLTVDAFADPVNIAEGGSSELTALPIVNNYNYQWAPSETLSNSNSRITTASPLVTTTYNITVIDIGEFGVCLRSDSVTVYVFETICGVPNIFVPNTFTPNNDGENDEVWVRGANITDLEFSIFNRWGELVFKTSDQTVGWDGTYKGNLAEPAVYVYHLRAKCGDGQNFITKGNITLLR